MNSQILRTSAKCLLFLGFAIASRFAVADDVIVPHYRFHFNKPQPAGVEFRRTPEMRVRGWQMTKKAWFGQTRVANRIGFGFVYSNGRTVYQLNNRGLQVTRYF